MSFFAAKDAAQEQLATLLLPEFAGRLPPALVGVVAATVRNPAASSDALLILADALRQAGASWEIRLASEAAMRTLADRLAAIAPARAEPPFTD